MAARPLKESSVPSQLYPVIAEWDDAAHAWSLLSPDFPEIASVARDPDEMAQHAQDALLTAFEARVGDGEALPSPAAEPWLLTQGWTYPTRNMLLFVPVPAQAPPAEPVRVNVRLDKDLLARIESEASRLGISRSAFLAESAKTRLRG